LAIGYISRLEIRAAAKVLLFPTGATLGLFLRYLFPDLTKASREAPNGRPTAGYASQGGGAAPAPPSGGSRATEVGKKGG